MLEVGCCFGNTHACTLPYDRREGLAGQHSQHNPRPGPLVECSIALAPFTARLAPKRTGGSMRTMIFALAAAALAIAAPATAGPTEDFHALMDQYWATYLNDNPLTASSVSVRTFDRTLGELSLAEFDRQADEARDSSHASRNPRSLAEHDGPGATGRCSNAPSTTRCVSTNSASASCSIRRSAAITISWRPWARTSPCTPSGLTRITSPASRSFRRG